MKPEGRRGGVARGNQKRKRIACFAQEQAGTLGNRHPARPPKPLSMSRPQSFVRKAAMPNGPKDILAPELVNGKREPEQLNKTDGSARWLLATRTGLRQSRAGVQTRRHSQGVAQC